METEKFTTPALFYWGNDFPVVRLVERKQAELAKADRYDYIKFCGSSGNYNLNST